MRRVRGPVFPLLRHPVPPLSASGRVLVAVLFAIWAFALSVAWSPAFADDGEASKAEREASPSLRCAVAGKLLVPPALALRW